ncbi:nucleic acid-binding domain protein, partial [Ostertagia ostertagi]
AKSSCYTYTTLQNLPVAGRVNVYGVVYSITALTLGGRIIEIADENGTVYAKISKESETFFKKLQMKDILRLHRVEVGSYRGEKTLIVEIGAHGCHAVAWSGSSARPKLITSKKYTFDDQDITRRSELLKWCENGEINEEVPSRSDNVNLPNQNPSAEQTSTSSPTKENLPMKLPKPKICTTVKSASDIPPLWNKFFNWYAEVLGVYKGKGEPFTVFVKGLGWITAEFS